MIKAIPHAICGTQCHQSKTDADVKRENTKMWELYPILGKKKTGKFGTFCIYFGGQYWLNKLNWLDFKNIKRKYRFLQKILLNFSSS